MPSPRASRLNLRKANAKWRPPRPWRSERESRLIRCLVYQWVVWAVRQQNRGEWSYRAVARWLGVSRTWVRRLVRALARDLRMVERVRKEQRLYGVATFEDFCQAQDETWELRRRGLLRPQAKVARIVPRIAEPPLWATSAFVPGLESDPL